MFKCMANISNITLVYGDLVVMQKEGEKWIPQFIKPHEWENVKTGQLRDSSTPTSLKRIDISSSNVGTYHPGICIMYSSKKN